MPVTEQEHRQICDALSHLDQARSQLGQLEVFHSEQHDKLINEIGKLDALFKKTFTDIRDKYITSPDKEAYRYVASAKEFQLDTPGSAPLPQIKPNIVPTRRPRKNKK